jgi:hypothetical protein
MAVRRKRSSEAGSFLGSVFAWVALDAADERGAFAVGTFFETICSPC